MNLDFEDVPPTEGSLQRKRVRSDEWGNYQRRERRLWSSTVLTALEEQGDGEEAGCQAEQNHLEEEKQN